MGTTVRYFGLTGNGTADGTSWANRAAGFVAGAWSTIITGFDFSGTDALECRFESGTHTVNSLLDGTSFTTAPSPSNPLSFYTADAAGGRWAPPNPAWTSDTPSWVDSGMAVWDNTSAGVGTINVGSVFGIKITDNGTSANQPIGPSVIHVNWCILDAVGSSAYTGLNAQEVVNCISRVSGLAYKSLFQLRTNYRQRNLRAEGNASATSGSRIGFYYSSSRFIHTTECTSINNLGYGIYQPSSWHYTATTVENCVMYNSGVGVFIGVSGSDIYSCVNRCFVTGSSSYGVQWSQTATARLAIENNRLRDNTAGNIQIASANAVAGVNDESAGLDADEYVDAASGDFRIKNTSSSWGKNLGVSDEPAAAGGAPVTTAHWG